jgi:NADP-dependent 3-hydroxy acid dehydrogenase YdfG
MEQAKKVMDVNFYGPLALVKAFLPGLLKRPEAHILNVSSMGAYAPVPGHTSVPDFQKFFDDPFTLFEKDLKNIYR